MEEGFTLLAKLLNFLTSCFIFSSAVHNVFTFHVSTHDHSVIGFYLFDITSKLWDCAISSLIALPGFTCDIYEIVITCNYLYCDEAS